jgi:hypothetical protein
MTISLTITGHVEVAELAYAQRLERCPARVVGSNPTLDTI